MEREKVRSTLCVVKKKQTNTRRTRARARDELSQKIRAQSIEKKNMSSHVLASSFLELSSAFLTIRHN